MGWVVGWVVVVGGCGGGGGGVMVVCVGPQRQVGRTAANAVQNEVRAAEFEGLQRPALF